MTKGKNSIKVALLFAEWGLLILFFYYAAPLIQGKGAVETYKAMVGYMGIEDCGVCALSGEENKNEGKMAEIKAWAKGL